MKTISICQLCCLQLVGCCECCDDRIRWNGRNFNAVEVIPKQTSLPDVVNLAGLRMRNLILQLWKPLYGNFTADFEEQPFWSSFKVKRVTWFCISLYFLFSCWHTFEKSKWNILEQWPLLLLLIFIPNIWGKTFSEDWLYSRPRPRTSPKCKRTINGQQKIHYKKQNERGL